MGTPQKSIQSREGKVAIMLREIGLVSPTCRLTVTIWNVYLLKKNLTQAHLLLVSEPPMNIQRLEL